MERWGAAGPRSFLRDSAMLGRQHEASRWWEAGVREWKAFSGAAIYPHARTALRTFFAPSGMHSRVSQSSRNFPPIVRLQKNNVQKLYYRVQTEKEKASFLFSLLPHSSCVSN